METDADQPTQIRATSAIVSQYFPPIEQISRPTLTTEEAAYYLNLRPQTMRAHASKEDFPIRPTRICGRLHWSTKAIRTLLNGGRHD